MKASRPVDKAEKILMDDTNIRWTQAEMLMWVNSALTAIVDLKPDSLVKNEPMALVAGTKQSFPAGCVMGLDVTRNMGVNGTTPGRAITPAARKVLDDGIPGWHSMVGTAEVQHAIFDVRDTKRFYVFPPSLGTTQVEVVYSALPAQLTSLEDDIQIDEISENWITDYILYRAYLKEQDGAGNAERAAGFYSAFVGGVKGREETKEKNAPKSSTSRKE